MAAPGTVTEAKAALVLNAQLRARCENNKFFYDLRQFRFDIAFPTAQRRSNVNRTLPQQILKNAEVIFDS